jgi:hypothetical protein
MQRECQLIPHPNGALRLGDVDQQVIAGGSENGVPLTPQVRRQAPRLARIARIVAAPYTSPADHRKNSATRHWTSMLEASCLVGLKPDYLGHRTVGRVSARLFCRMVPDRLSTYLTRCALPSHGSRPLVPGLLTVVGEARCGRGSAGMGTCTVVPVGGRRGGAVGSWGRRRLKRSMGRGNSLEFMRPKQCSSCASTNCPGREIGNDCRRPVGA